jgi:hypothetical protein
LELSPANQCHVCRDLIESSGQLKKSESLIHSAVNNINGMLSISSAASKETEIVDKSVLPTEPNTLQKTPEGSNGKVDHIISTTVSALQRRVANVSQSKMLSQLATIVKDSSSLQDVNSEPGYREAVIIGCILSTVLSADLIHHSTSLSIQSEGKESPMSGDAYLKSLRHRIQRIGDIINGSMDQKEPHFSASLSPEILSRVMGITAISNAPTQDEHQDRDDRLMLAVAVNKSVRKASLGRIFAPSSTGDEKSSSMPEARAVCAGNAVVLLSLLFKAVNRPVKDEELTECVCKSMNEGFTVEVLLAAGFIFHWMESGTVRSIFRLIMLLLTSKYSSQSWEQMNSPFG